MILYIRTTLYTSLVKIFSVDNFIRTAMGLGYPEGAKYKADAELIN